MIDLEALSLPHGQRLTLTLAHFVWQGFTVMLICRIVLKIASRGSSQIRYVVSLVGLVVMAICPLATYDFLQARSPAAYDATLDNHLENAVHEDHENHNAGVYLRAQPHLLAAWLGGVILLSLKLAFGGLSLLYLRNGRQAVPSHLAHRFGRLARRFGLNARRTVFVSRKVHEALVIGFLRPAILLPVTWVSELPAETLEAIIAHELAHIRRWDLWVNLGQRAIETLLFYHPAVWWISRQVRIEREMCCDELAVAATGDRIVYANALEQAARQRIASRQPALAAALRGESQMALLRRIRNVLEVQPHDRQASWLPFLLLLALGATVFAVVATGGFIGEPTAVFADDDDDGEERETRDEDRERDEDRRERDEDRERDVNRQRAAARERGEARERGKREESRRERDGDRERDESRRERDEEARERREGDRGAASRGGSQEVILRLLMELRHEVATLRHEVRELREHAARQQDGAAREREMRAHAEEQQLREHAARQQDGAAREREMRAHAEEQRRRAQSRSRQELERAEKEAGERGELERKRAADERLNVIRRAFEERRQRAEDERRGKDDDE
ncbi:MAG: hypothetical protein CMJ64_02025 [Planctomycetaceae bacterium]|nr:hypothetical protein [Planctomycetaceae bacterium]